MELDQTKVPVRERNILEIWDLSLSVVRDFSPGLLLAMLAGILPFAIANGLLIVWLQSSWDATEWAYCYWLLMILVFIQAPLATSLGTLYLGDAMFFQQPSWRKMFSTLWRVKGRLLLCQGLFRGVLPAFGLALTTASPEVAVGDVVLPILFLYLVFIGDIRPFLNEIILLEQNPLSSTDERSVTIGRRCTRLHGPNTGDLLLRNVAGEWLALLLTLSLCMGVWFVYGIVFSSWQWNWWMSHIVAPGSMWATASYFAVVRYLSYLDLRIRREGWAVELQLRAEATRLTHRPVV